MLIKENHSLKSLNTFGIEASCSFFIEINSITEFVELTQLDVYQNHTKLIIGGGSNLLFTENFKGLVIKNNLKGISIVNENEDVAYVKVAAGEVWHEFVTWCIKHNLAGLENLSLIPGCVGASPMQNIGAYGVEIKDVFEELEAYDMILAAPKIFKNSDCEFGYRESVFKNKFKNHYLITSVTFKLNKKPVVNTSYGAINAELAAMKIENPTIQHVSEAVIRIRQSKLPDPKITGNAGSFFKNPEVTEEKYLQLKKDFPDLVAYPTSSQRYKLAAGWLIEQCGLKGYELNGAAVHLKQALVLINKNNCTGKDVFNLSTHVLETVNNKFGVLLEREVNIM